MTNHAQGDCVQHTSWDILDADFRQCGATDRRSHAMKMRELGHGLLEHWTVLHLGVPFGVVGSGTRYLPPLEKT